MSKQCYQIAIDGYSGCGKSTLAKDLARVTGWLHLDTGAMYRAVSLYLYREKIDIHDEDDIASSMKEVSVDFIESNGLPVVRLNGQVAEPEIRSHYISSIVSHVAVSASVRENLVRRQQELGQSQNVIADGRDIGTVVFPKADLKLFLSANIDTRVDRRWRELKGRGTPQSRSDIRNNLLTRDRIDSGRDIGPLRKAGDAIDIDTSDLTRDEQLDRVLRLMKDRLGLSYDRRYS